MTIGVGSKDNFPKYKRLVDAFKIPCVFIGDEGVQNERGNKEIFKSPTYIAKDGIKGDSQNIFVTKGGNLEFFMKQINAELYSDIEDKIKMEYKSRDPPKPVVAYRFAEKVSENPEALRSIKEMLIKILLFIKNYRSGIDTSPTLDTSSDASESAK